MPNKKSSDSKNDLSNFSAFDPELEAKVDAMMVEGAEMQPIAPEEVAPDFVMPAPESTKITVNTGQDPVEHLTIVSSAPDVPDSISETMEEITLTDSEQNEVLLPSEDTVLPPKPHSAIEPDATDPSLDAVVDDITIAEADAVLAADDAKIAAATVVVTPPKRRHRIRGFFGRWWRNPVARWATILLVVGGIIAAGAVPYSRYYVLNIAGVRSSASIIIIDDFTGQPLQNVTVAIGERSAKTDDSGTARLSEVRLGSQQLVVSRVAFATIDKPVTIGWGSNPLGELSLKATGVQYVLNAEDYLSGKAVTTAKATNGDATAQADDKGKIVLTLEDPNGETVDITITADEYRTETLTIPATTIDAQTVRMVPSQPLVYVTKQQGTFDLYKVDVDGKNKQVVLKGTGTERPNMSLMTSPDGAYTAFVSSREKRYDSENYLLDTLSLINLKTGEVKKIDQAQNIQLIAWRGEQLIYRAAYAAPSAATNDRQRLVSYDVAESARTVLANGNYFVGIYSVDDTIYYGVSTPGVGDGGAFAKVKFDGSGKKTILSRSIWSVNQTKPDEMYINADDSWYKYEISKDALSKQETPQDAYLTTVYFMAPNKQYGALIDQRDGQGVLVFTAEGKPETTLATARSVYGPVTWLNATTISYYVDTGSETAQYVVSTQGGKPVKVSTATLVSGAGAGYY